MNNPQLYFKNENGVKWLRIFHHDFSGGFFNSKEEALNSNHFRKFSILSYLSSSYKINGAYRFLLDYPEAGSIDWSQEFLPTETTETETNFQRTDIKIHRNDNDFTHFRGLMLTSTSDSLIDGDKYSLGRYWYSIGTISYGNIIPGPYVNDITKEVNSVTLWIRVRDTCITRQRCSSKFSLNTILLICLYS